MTSFSSLYHSATSEPGLVNDAHRLGRTDERLESAFDPMNSCVVDLVLLENGEDC